MTDAEQQELARAYRDAVDMLAGWKRECHALKLRAEAAEAQLQALQQRIQRQSHTIQQRQESWTRMRDGAREVEQRMRNAVAGLGASDDQVLRWADLLATLTQPGAASPETEG